MIDTLGRRYLHRMPGRIRSRFLEDGRSAIEWEAARMRDPQTGLDAELRSVGLHVDRGVAREDDVGHPQARLGPARDDERRGDDCREARGSDGVMPAAHGGQCSRA